jgi:hypothetical protein
MFCTFDALLPLSPSPVAQYNNNNHNNNNNNNNNNTQSLSYELRVIQALAHYIKFSRKYL